MDIEYRREKSKHIFNWLKEHPLINIHMLCQMAGSPDSANFNNAMAGKNRLISKKYLHAIEKLLQPYGYVPLKIEPLKE